jgi:hypothetical protein
MGNRDRQTCTLTDRQTDVGDRYRVGGKKKKKDRFDQLLKQMYCTGYFDSTYITDFYENIFKFVGMHAVCVI